MLRLFLLAAGSLLISECYSQYNWKPEKDKNGIKVFLSDVPGSSFKAVKVECTLTGTYAKLISLLTNVSKFEDWIYHNKASKLLQQKTSLDFIYYSETKMPWPLSNRYLMIHLQINTDSLQRFLTITGKNDESLSFPNIPGMVKVPHYKAVWKVTMPTARTLHIEYILELNPGGTIPAWISNSYIDKGPYGTFSNLAELLKK